MIAKPGGLRHGLGCACRMRLCGPQVGRSNALPDEVSDVRLCYKTCHGQTLGQTDQVLQEKLYASAVAGFSINLRAFAFNQTAFAEVSSRSKDALMQKQQKRRVFGQQVPWQVSVGVAFAVTVICCAQRRRHKGRRERGTRTNASAAITEQVPGRRTTEDFKDLRQTGKAVAKDCHLPPLRVIVVDEALSCTVQQLWHIICKPDPSFQSTIHRLSNNREIQYGDWHQEDGDLVRKETYINPLKKNNLGPREAFCIDQQRCIRRGPSGFVLERKVYTPQVPFGGSFHNQVQWCAWVEPGSDRVRLQISCDVVFTKKWVPVKNIINSSSIEGMERFYKMWLQQLHHHLGLLNSPSQSVATRSPQGHSQTALKKKKKRIAEPAPWNTEALLSWVTVLAMLCWLVYQSYQQAQNPHGIQGSPYRMWSSNSSALPSSTVPVVHYH